MLMRASCVVLFLLLSVSFAHAASTPEHRATDAKCDEHSATLKKLIRHAKSFGGPLARPQQRPLFGLTDITARLQRAPRANTDDEHAAIQNDAPAANINADVRATPTLQPLGLLVGPLDGQPRTRTFSPKSPRGPPLTA
jgi:hypothetical protein